MSFISRENGQWAKKDRVKKETVRNREGDQAGRDVGINTTIEVEKTNHTTVYLKNRECANVHRQRSQLEAPNTPQRKHLNIFDIAHSSLSFLWCLYYKGRGKNISNLYSSSSYSLLMFVHCCRTGVTVF